MTMDSVKMINGITGTEMSVPSHLVEMFLKAGHKLAEEPKAPAAKKAPAKKTRAR